MGGVFCKNGDVFVKKVENRGCFFVKKVDLSSTQGALGLCTVSVFFILLFTYLGDVYAPNAKRACKTFLLAQRVCERPLTRYMQDAYCKFSGETKTSIFS